MRMTYILSLMVLLAQVLHARVLPVGSGGYANLEAAAAAAQPGDTILYRSGTHAGGAYVASLQGRPDAWITITGEAGALIQGGNNAFQLTDPAYLRITRLAFDGQTGNGLNIDDGGSSATPAHHLLIEECAWRGIGATGNNDMLKMSGVDSFTVRHCSFVNGSPGGSMIDMVGCHFGVFEGNRFENAGSNCIQAKGGTQYITIRRNRFWRGGQRAINIGGSTGLEFFRPIDAPFEASHILVHSNIFTGAVAPIAFVGAVNCAVTHNTIFLPEKWAVRILQETTGARFLPCGDNTFINNLVVIDNRAASPTFNIGPDTAPESFQFRNNLWFNVENTSWAGPNTPTPNIDAIIGRDPLLRAPAPVDGDFSLRDGSPAIGAGTPLAAPLMDFFEHQFNVPPSIGAIEGNPPVSDIIGLPTPISADLRVWPHPVTHGAWVEIRGFGAGRITVALVDAAGIRVEEWKHEVVDASRPLLVNLPARQRPAGWYLLHVSDGTRHAFRPLLVF
ncbi:MAG: right-handed parallel beta-helix repeat-containing protein [Bacteroidota bacterium]|jgi:hypothetical protein|nr:right-handed parallel beta-helix repeat-containing protein [Bacteroidota bacterium]